MWSVNALPNFRSARAASRSSRVCGCGEGFTVKVVTAVPNSYVAPEGSAVVTLPRGSAQGGGDRGCDLTRGSRRAIPRGYVRGDRVVDPGRVFRHPQVIEHQRDGEDRRRRIGFALPGDVGGGTVHRLEHRREFPRGVDIARGSEPNTAGNGAGEVSDDVAEEVVGHDDVVLRGVRVEVDHRRVHVLVVHLDLGIFLPDGVHGTAPQVPGMDEHVVLVHERELLAPRLGPGKGITYDPLHAVGGIDGDLGGDLVRGAHAQRSPIADVGALSAFPHDDEVDLTRLREGAGDPGV